MKTLLKFQLIALTLISASASARTYYCSRPTRMWQGQEYKGVETFTLSFDGATATVRDLKSTFFNEPWKFDRKALSEVVLTQVPGKPAGTYRAEKMFQHMNYYHLTAYSGGQVEFEYGVPNVDGDLDGGTFFCK